VEGHAYLVRPYEVRAFSVPALGEITGSGSRVRVLASMVAVDTPEFAPAVYSSVASENFQVPEPSRCMPSYRPVISDVNVHVPSSTK
jgi:hypothetical protein